MPRLAKKVPLVSTDPKTHKNAQCYCCESTLGGASYTSLFGRICYQCMLSANTGSRSLKGFKAYHEYKPKRKRTRRRQ